MKCKDDIKASDFFKKGHKGEHERDNGIFFFKKKGKPDEWIFKNI